LIEYDQNSLKLKKSDERLSLRANLTLIEPNFGPWGPYTTPKVGSIRRYFLDFSLDHFLVILTHIWTPGAHLNQILDPEGHTCYDSTLQIIGICTICFLDP
jgi:hypothetical protein